MKNITFSIEESIIKKAKEKANHQHISLNKLFKQWLNNYINHTDDYEQLMKRLNYADAGKKFTRDELNER